MTTRSDGTDQPFDEADPADVAEQQRSVDPAMDTAATDAIDETGTEIIAEAEPADVLEQQIPVGGEEDYPRN